MIDIVNLNFRVENFTFLKILVEYVLIGFVLVVSSIKLVREFLQRLENKKKEVVVVDDDDDEEEEEEDEEDEFEEKEEEKVKRIGKVVVYTDRIGNSTGNATRIYEGLYDGRHPVAVKRLCPSDHILAVREYHKLKASGGHPNVVTYYGIIEDPESDYYKYCYVYHEPFLCSLFDFVTKNSNSCHSNNNGGYPSRQALTFMRDIVSGLAYLHKIGIKHRDVQPSNILIVEERSVLRAKLSDVGIRIRNRNFMFRFPPGWRAPEYINHSHSHCLHVQHTTAMDMFSLGCVFFFIITGGKHPFGDDPDEWNDNIVENKPWNLQLLQDVPEALDLMTQLLDPNPEKRPEAMDVLNHPLFWDSSTRPSWWGWKQSLFNHNRMILQGCSNYFSTMVLKLLDRVKYL